VTLDECHCATDDGRGSGECVSPSEPRDLLRTRSSKQMRGYLDVEELRTIESGGSCCCCPCLLNESGLLAESSLGICICPLFYFWWGPLEVRVFLSFGLGCVC
jgi:hypothetical protein